MIERPQLLAVILAAAGFVCSLPVLAARVSVESRNRATAIVMDDAELRDLALASAVPYPAVLRRMRDAGATGAVVTEPSIGELIDDGILSVQPPEAPGGAVRLSTESSEVRARLRDRLPAVPPGSPGEGVSLLGVEGEVLAWNPGRLSEISTLPAGLDPQEIETVREAGLEPVARILSSPRFDPIHLETALREFESRGVRVVIFAGDQIPGHRKRLDETAEVLRRSGIIYGDIELGKQKGAEALARRLPDRMLRVHSISPAEMGRLGEAEARERYVRAASERNIRLLYVRSPDSDPSDPLGSAARFVHGLTVGLGRASLAPAAGRPFSFPWSEGSAALFLTSGIAIGVGAAGALLLMSLFSIRGPAAAGLIVACSGAALGLMLLSADAARPLLALSAAVVFPSIAAVWPALPLGACNTSDMDGRTAAWPLAFLRISGITLVGALMTAALLSSLPYMVKVASFQGIKLATIAPLILALVAYAGGLPCGSGSARRVIHRARESFEALGSSPLRAWHVAALAAGGAAAILLLLRSGNEPGLEVSGLELRLRAFLDQVLLVRPRTKEFAVGHPALLLSLAMMARPAWRRVAFPLFVIGLVGQVGMLNSFCHLHSPLLQTFIRTFNGLWVGAILGCGAVFLWSAVAAPGSSRKVKI